MDRIRVKENELSEIQKTSQVEITYFSRQSLIYCLSSGECYKALNRKTTYALILIL